MDKNWVVFLVLWAVVEFIQFLRKQPFPKRMLNGAVWAVFLISLADLGQASKNVNTFGFLAIALGLNGMVAALICSLRIALAKIWSRVVHQRTSTRSLIPQPGAVTTLGTILGVWFKWLAVLFTLVIFAGAIFTALMWNK